MKDRFIYEESGDRHMVIKMCVPLLNSQANKVGSWNQSNQKPQSAPFESRCQCLHTQTIWQQSCKQYI